MTRNISSVKFDAFITYWYGKDAGEFSEQDPDAT